MRVLYGTFLVVLCAALFIGWQKWRGPILPAIKVTMLPLELRLVASGEVRSQSLAHLGSEITGRVTARHVREGDWVKKGDLLIELNSQTFESSLAQAKIQLQQLQTVSRPQAQAALLEAQNNLAQISREARRREALAKKGTLPIEQVEQAQRLELNAKTVLTRAQITVASLAFQGTEEILLQERLYSAELDLAKTRIYAPFAGRVQTRNVEPGDLIQPGKILLELAPTTGLEVVVALDEKNFAPVQLNQPVQLIADAWPKQTVAGKVNFIAPTVDSKRGTLDVHISLPPAGANNPNTFLQGMTVSANIIIDQRDRTLVVPNDYLVFNTNSAAQVFCWNNGKVTAVPVQLGLRTRTHSEITAGLVEGDIVVQTAKVNDGQRTQISFEQVQHVIR